MAALALCGTAVAEDMYIPTSDPLEIYNDGVTVHVNNPANPGYIMVSTEGAATFKFYGENIISSTAGYLYSDGAGFNITGDEAAINHWVSALTSPTGELKSVTLMNFTYLDVETGTDDDFTFDGHLGGETVTLGNVSVELLGSVYMQNGAFELLSEAVGENQIAFVRTDNSLALVGKITGSPATPEPATATLSLMALAGMVTRRRRK